MGRPQDFFAGFVRWIRRSRVRRWWFRFGGWTIALLFVLRTMDTLEFARTGEPWIKEFRSDDGKLISRMAYESDDPAMRFLQNVQMMAVGALGLWLANEWRFSIRDVLIFGTACAIGLAAPNLGVWMLIALGFAIYLWRTTAPSVEV